MTAAISDSESGAAPHMRPWRDSKCLGVTAGCLPKNIAETYAIIT